MCCFTISAAYLNPAASQGLHQRPAEGPRPGGGLPPPAHLRPAPAGRPLAARRGAAPAAPLPPGTAAGAAVPAAGARQRALLRRAGPHTAGAGWVCSPTFVDRRLFLLSSWVLFSSTGKAGTIPSSSAGVGGEGEAGLVRGLSGRPQPPPAAGGKGKASPFLPPGSSLQRNKMNRSVLFFIFYFF